MCSSVSRQRCVGLSLISFPMEVLTGNPPILLSSAWNKNEPCLHFSWQVLALRTTQTRHPWNADKKNSYTIRPPPHKRAQEEFGISLGLLMGPDLSWIRPIYPVWVSCIFLGVSLSGRLCYVAPLTTLCTTNVSLRSGVSRNPNQCSPVKIMGSVNLPISTIHPQLSFWRLAEDTTKPELHLNHIYKAKN